MSSLRQGRTALMWSILVIATGAGGSCDVPGKAALRVSVEPPAGGMPPAAPTRISFTVRASVADVSQDYQWDPLHHAYTIRGIAVSGDEIVRVEGRLFDANEEIGSVEGTALLKPGAWSDPITLTIKWKVPGNAGSMGSDATGGEGAAPDAGAMNTPPAGNTDAAPDAGAMDSPPGGKADVAPEVRTFTPCREGETMGPCGSCGTERCIGGIFQCKGDGRSELCGDCGTRTCQNFGSWTLCEGNGGSKACGQCGFQMCMVVGIWGACQPSGLTRPCPTGSGTQACGSYGNWDFVCRK